MIIRETTRKAILRGSINNHEPFTFPRNKVLFLLGESGIGRVGGPLRFPRWHVSFKPGQFGRVRSYST